MKRAELNDLVVKRGIKKKGEDKEQAQNRYSKD